MSSKLQLGVSCLSQGWRHLVNAYEGKAGMVYLQVKLCDPCLAYKRRYINTLPFLSFELNAVLVLDCADVMCNFG